MTIDQLIELLPKDGWRVREGGHIRRDNCGECPMEAVSGVSGLAASQHYLLMSGEDTHQIFLAADNQHGQDKQLRARLLAACGLTENTP